MRGELYHKLNAVQLESMPKRKYRSMITIRSDKPLHHEQTHGHLTFILSVTLIKFSSSRKDRLYCVFLELTEVSIDFATVLDRWE